MNSEAKILSLNGRMKEQMETVIQNVYIKIIYASLFLRE